MRSEAPWTEEQVANLCEWQKSDFMHPFTCPNHGGVSAGCEVHWIEVILLPTRTGFVCSDRNCDYTQTWAHMFMMVRTCPDCGGDGCYYGHAQGCWGSCNNHGCPIQMQCSRCYGSGMLGEDKPPSVYTGDEEPF